MAVKVTTSPALQLSDPVKLFSGYDGGTYAVAPDGRFLMAVASSQFRESNYRDSQLAAALRK